MAVTHDRWEGGQAIRRRREALGLSRERLAREVGCSTSYLQLLENGFAPAYSHVIPLLLAVLDDLEVRAA
jgi:transcriptional regulator with XRE-family HTH domain